MPHSKPSRRTASRRDWDARGKAKAHQSPTPCNIPGCTRLTHPGRIGSLCRLHLNRDRTRGSPTRSLLGPDTMKPARRRIRQYMKLTKDHPGWSSALALVNAVSSSPEKFFPNDEKHRAVRDGLRSYFQPKTPGGRRFHPEDSLEKLVAVYLIRTERGALVETEDALHFELARCVYRLPSWLMRDKARAKGAYLIVGKWLTWILGRFFMNAVRGLKLAEEELGGQLVLTNKTKRKKATRRVLTPLF